MMTSCRFDENMDRACGAVCQSRDRACGAVCQSSKQGACMAHAPPEPRVPALIFGAHPNPPA